MSPAHGEADTPAQADPAVLDADALGNLAQLDPTGANRSSMKRLLAQLAQARVQSDAAGQRLVAHTLKSSSASVGALVLSQLCGDAEKALREGRPEVVPALLDQLVAEAARVDAAVLQLLADT